MCGIAGIIDQTARWLTREHLVNMIEAASHRSPDGHGRAFFDERGGVELLRSDIDDQARRAASWFAELIEARTEA